VRRGRCWEGERICVNVMVVVNGGVGVHGISWL
jgi:hypothetical protein